MNLIVTNSIVDYSIDTDYKHFNDFVMSHLILGEQ